MADFQVPACRLVACVFLKYFLVWVIGNSTHGSAAFPVWQGWAWAGALSATGYAQCLMHHQLFWCARKPQLHIMA
jgi:hypothetical protein